MKQSAGTYTAASGILFVIGSFLPWASVFGLSVSGTDGGDGWIVIIAGAVLAALGFLATKGTTFPAWITWIALAVAAAVTLINFFDIMGNDLASTGIGMWLLVVAVIIGVYGVIAGRKSEA